MDKATQATCDIAALIASVSQDACVSMHVHLHGISSSTPVSSATLRNICKMNKSWIKVASYESYSMFLVTYKHAHKHDQCKLRCCRGWVSPRLNTLVTKMQVLAVKFLLRVRLKLCIHRDHNFYLSTCQMASLGEVPSLTSFINSGHMSKEINLHICAKFQSDLRLFHSALHIKPCFNICPLKNLCTLLGKRIKFIICTESGELHQSR